MNKNRHINGNASNGNATNGSSGTDRRRGPRPQPAPPEFFDLLGRGTSTLQQGRIVEALTLLEQAQALKPDDPDVLLNLSGAYILSKQWKKAIDILEPLSERQPSNPMVWTNLGAAYLGNPVLATDEKQQRSIGAFKLAIALDSNAPNVAYNLGLIYRDRQEYDEAINWFNRALEANPNDSDARLYIEQLGKKLQDDSPPDDSQPSE